MTRARLVADGRMTIPCAENVPRFAYSSKFQNVGCFLITTNNSQQQHSPTQTQPHPTSPGDRGNRAPLLYLATLPAGLPAGAHEAAPRRRGRAVRALLDPAAGGPPQPRPLQEGDFFFLSR